jgi:hypothetical protein
MTTRFPALALVLTLGLGVAACDDDDNPAGPSDEEVRFTAALLASNEVPPVTGSEAGATGTMTATLNLDRDSSNNITAATMDFTVTLANLPPTTAISGAHIHTGAAGQVNPILFDTGLGQNQVTVAANGTATFTRNDVSLASNLGQVQTMINNPAGFYFNVHSTANPGGFARGQLIKQ